MWRKIIFKWQLSKLLWIWIFGAVVKVRTTEKNYYLGRLLWSCLKAQAGFAEQEKKLYCHLDCSSEWQHSLYLELVTCDLYSWCRINSYLLASDSIGEWLRDHEETTLVIFRSWSRYLSSMCFHVFFHKLSNKLLWHFCLFFSFFFQWNCISSILRNELKQFASGTVLSFAKKNLSWLPILNWRVHQPYMEGRD